MHCQTSRETYQKRARSSHWARNRLLLGRVKGKGGGRKVSTRNGAWCIPSWWGIWLPRWHSDSSPIRCELKRAGGLECAAVVRYDVEL